MGRGGQALPRERLHCQLPFISPDLPSKTKSYPPENLLTLSRTYSMIYLASPFRALMLPMFAGMFAGTDISRKGQRSFRVF